jgi:hypothetical protein
MKALILVSLGAIALTIGLQYLETQTDPYEEGMHWDYSIRCEDGFLWKSLDNHRGTIPVLHSDGTHMRCGEKRH